MNEVKTEDQKKFYPVTVHSDYNKIYATYRNALGEYKKEVISDFQHYMFSADVNNYVIDERIAKKLFTNNLGDMKRNREDIPNTYEGDLSFARRWCVDKFTKYQMLPEVKIRFLFVDIENDYKDEMLYDGEMPVTAITCYDSYTKRLYTFAFSSDGQAYFDPDNTIAVYDNELEMWDNFLKFITWGAFDLISGWNVQFDFKYITGRMKRLEIPIERLSVFGKINYFAGKYTIYGTNVVDYMEMYKKWSQNTLQSYSLDFVSRTELGEGKIKFQGRLRDLWRNDLKKYIEYNRQDVALLARLEEKLGFVSFLDSLRRIGIVNLGDGLSNMTIIDSILFRILKSRGLLARTKKKDGWNEDDEVVGAYNYDRFIPGRYHWVIDNDVTSEYPHAQMIFNISPDTYVGKLYDEDLQFINSIDFFNDKNLRLWEEGKISDLVGQAPKHKQVVSDMDIGGMTGIKFYSLAEALKRRFIIAPNGALFTTEKLGVMPALIDWLYNERDRLKTLMKEARAAGDEELYRVRYSIQYAVKRLANSCYGILASEFYRFGDKNLAEAITMTGQNVLKCAINEVINLDKYVIIAGDSVAKDSIIECSGGRTRSIEQIWDECISKVYIGDDGKERKLYDNDYKIYTCSKRLKSRFSMPYEIIRHKTNKKIYRVYISKHGDERFPGYVDVTEDHSLIGYYITVFGDKKVIEVKPEELKEKKYIKLITMDCVNEVIDIKEIEYDDYVYDLCIPETQTFFANGILVHNTDSIFMELGDENVETVSDARRIGLEISNMVNDTVKSFVERKCNVPVDLKKRFSFKQEKVAKTGTFYAKKHYSLHEVNSEGTDIDHVVHVGISIVRNDTPELCKRHLEGIYNEFVKSGETEEFETMCVEYKEFIEKGKPEEIGIPTKINQKFESYKGNSIHVMGAKYWNNHYGKDQRINWVSDANVGYYIYVTPKKEGIEYTHVISVPEGAKFPSDDFDIDYGQMMERLYTLKLADANYVIEIEKIKEDVYIWLLEHGYKKRDFYLLDKWIREEHIKEFKNFFFEYFVRKNSLEKLIQFDGKTVYISMKKMQANRINKMINDYVETFHFSFISTNEFFIWLDEQVHNYKKENGK